MFRFLSENFGIIICFLKIIEKDKYTNDKVVKHLRFSENAYIAHECDKKLPLQIKILEPYARCFVDELHYICSKVN